MDPARPSDDGFLTRHATRIAYGILAVVMLVPIVLFWRQSQSNEDTKRSLLHTYEVLTHIELLSGRIKEALVAQRGFVATGNPEFLEPYENALRDGPNPDGGYRTLQQHRSIEQELAVIRKLTADNPSQQGNLDELEQQTRKLLDYIAATIQKQKESGTTPIATQIDLLRGKSLMDDIRSLTRIMRAEENQLLEIRTQVDQNNDHQFNRLALIIAALFYMAITLSIWLYQRNRAQSREQMLLYTQELEKREEELKMQQEELKASNEEIEASNEELEEKTRALEEQNAHIPQAIAGAGQTKQLIEEKARELELSSKYKSEFLANMSHELRTPLNSPPDPGARLAGNEEGNLTEEQVEEASVIHNGGLELLGADQRHSRSVEGRGRQDQHHSGRCLYQQHRQADCAAIRAGCQRNRRRLPYQQSAKNLPEIAAHRWHSGSSRS